MDDNPQILGMILDDVNDVYLAKYLLLSYLHLNSIFLDEGATRAEVNNAHSCFTSKRIYDFLNDLICRNPPRLSFEIQKDTVS
ncbi:hypothetical protein D3C76_1465930 [compost metagenome]